jgi:hypothetical protein
MGMFNNLKKIDKEDAEKEEARLNLEEAKKATNTPLSKPEPNKKQQEVASLLANQQTSKEENQLASKPANQQVSKESDFSNYKLKKKFGSYLREDSILELKMHALRSGRKDHEILQEAVDQFIRNLKNQ